MEGEAGNEFCRGFGGMASVPPEIASHAYNVPAPGNIARLDMADWKWRITTGFMVLNTILLVVVMWSLYELDEQADDRNQLRIIGERIDNEFVKRQRKKIDETYELVQTVCEMLYVVHSGFELDDCGEVML